jgi:hypothetical protein
MAVVAPRAAAIPWTRLRLTDARTGWVLLSAFWLVTRLVYLLNVMVGHHYPDDIFFVYAQRLSTGLLPYRDFPVEYPPLGIALIVLPGLAHVGPLTEWLYGTMFAVEMLALDLLALLLVVRLARGWVPGDPSGLLSGLLYTGFVAASGAVAQKFDLVAGIFCLVAVAAFVRRRDALAWGMLALAVLTKGFPLAIAPLFLMYRLTEGHQGYRSLLAAFFAAIRPAILACVALVTPLLALIGIQPLIHSVVYHVDRGVEIESMYAGVMLVLGRLPGLASLSYYNPGDLSQDIHSPLESVVDKVAVPLGLLLIGLAYWKFYRALRSRQEDRDGALLRAVMVVLLAFIVTFRALPGHYLLAILPPAAVLRFQGRRQGLFVSVLLGALVLGQLETVAWQALLDERLTGILALVARNGAILASFVLLLGGQMKPMVNPSAVPAQAGRQGLPTLALGWMVESGVHSWQEVPVPFDAYRKRSASLLAEQDPYLSRQQTKIL